MPYSLDATDLSSGAQIRAGSNTLICRRSISAG